jgi:hypothetical protein
MKHTIHGAFHISLFSNTHIICASNIIVGVYYFAWITTTPSDSFFNRASIFIICVRW